MAEEMSPEQVAAMQEKLKQMNPEEIQEMVKQQCIFCKIASGEIPSKKVYEDDDFLAFLDISPANAGHTLVVPKDHYSVLPQIPEEVAAKYFVLVKELSGKIFDALGAQGINVLQNNGPVAGQQVPHVHIHLIPRYEKDGIRLTWEPKKLEDSEIEEAMNKIKAKADEIDLKGFSAAKKKPLEVIDMDRQKEEALKEEGLKRSTPSPETRIP